MEAHNTYQKLDAIIADTRQAVHLRREDQLLMIRPEKTMGVNESAMEILSSLYARNAPTAEIVLRRVARRYGVELQRITKDAVGLIESIIAMMREDFSPRDNVRFVPFDRNRIQYPVLAEIALTYQCQNRCSFCYAASPTREQGPTMSTEQVKVVMEKIAHEAHVPTLSFTGGEATLRSDLPQLIRFGADLGLRMNLITNGLRAADKDYAKILVDHGLASAQVSIEAANAQLHDTIVGKKGAFEATVSGILAFRDLGIHVHTNSTLCAANFDTAQQIIEFVANELHLRTLSMNMLIRTGLGLSPSMQPIRYAQVAKRLPELLQKAEQHQVKFVWYSPVPYCVVNPVLLGQGAKSCACVSGIVSVNPAGELLPCSSFQQGIGSLLDNSFSDIYNSEAAKYWRERRYVPPPCAGCADVDICAGACPLYWDAAQSFCEIPMNGSNDNALFQRWNDLRKQGKSFGVPCPDNTSRDYRKSSKPAVRLPVLADCDTAANRAIPSVPQYTCATAGRDESTTCTL